MCVYGKIFSQIVPTVMDDYVIVMHVVKNAAGMALRTFKCKFS